MAIGARVTDSVSFHARRGEMRGAVRAVRDRSPERFRWRTAVDGVNQVAGKLRGRTRMRVEEPIRELVLDLDDTQLQRDIILDARRAGVDLDRGEVLPFRTLADLHRLAARFGISADELARYTRLPSTLPEPIDTAACAVVSRTLGEHHRRRAHRLWLEVPDPDGPVVLRPHHHYMLERAEQDRLKSQHWMEFCQALLGSAAG